MHLQQLEIRNFRLLREVRLLLEKSVTVIVGRNNTGKTSLTEVMRRVLLEKSASFRLEDFSFIAHQQIWEAFIAHSKGTSEEEVRKLLPSIDVRLTFSYEKNESLGILSDFVVDLDPTCTQVVVTAQYSLKDGQVADLFSDCVDTDEKAKSKFFAAIRERVPRLYTCSYFAVDPNDESNRRKLDESALRAACASGCISAQRGLDDTTSKDRAVIGKVLESLFETAKSNASDAGGHKTANELEEAVKNIQEQMGKDFNEKLDGLLPALSLFGYPGLGDSKLLTETTLDVTKLLTNHTKVRYAGFNGIHLPEAYNGLGARNIILILLQLREFFKLYLAMEPRPAVQIVFIEEPEVHLHPQMQEVFIRKLSEIAEIFSKEAGFPWPVQFVVSTHSSHLANEAHFESIRYFLSRSSDAQKGPYTVIKDLRVGLEGTKPPERDFLHQYMTLTRCDLFFADKAVLIEGTSERLLLPRIFQMLDANEKDELRKLRRQYVSVIEVGGAYAHLFFDLLTFLELRTLIITDIDSVEPNDKGHFVTCHVQAGKRSSNPCIKSWFKTDLAPSELLLKEQEKLSGLLRIAYQVPEQKDGPCGRSFEDAFMLANPKLFPLAGSKPLDLEIAALEEASKVKKAEFALKHALDVQDWNIPRYLREGLCWLSANEPITSSKQADPGGKP